MLRCRCLLAAALVAVVAITTFASAAVPSAHPAAGQVRTVTATVELGGLDGKTYVVDITARESDFVQQATNSEASIGWSACVKPKGHAVKCGPKHSYRIVLTTKQLTIASDGSTAHMLLTIASLSFGIVWTRDESTEAFTFSANTSGVSAGDPRSSGTARAAGRVFGTNCSGAGTVEIDDIVYTDEPSPLPGATGPVAAPAPLRPKGSHKPQCLHA